jgi:uncharacterized membrane protein YjfL (UPF0719 family)
MPISLEPLPLMLGLAHVALGVVVLIAAKFAKDFLSPYSMDQELTAKDNPAFGLAVAGYYAGIVIVFLGASRAGGLPADAGSDAALRALGVDLAWSVAGIAALALAHWLMERLLIPGVRTSTEIIERRNLAAGVVECGTYIATALAFAGALSQTGGSVLTSAVFLVLALIVLLIFGRAYQMLAGFSVGQQVQQGNFAAGIPLGLMLVALSLLLVKATSGDFVDWPTNLSYFAFDAAAGFILLMAMRWVVDLALLPNARIHDEIVRDRNVNVGLVEGVLAIAVAAIVLFRF